MNTHGYSEKYFTSPEVNKGILKLASKAKSLRNKWNNKHKQHEYTPLCLFVMGFRDFFYPSSRFPE